MNATVSSLRLGRRLRALRDQTGLTGRDVAAELRCSAAKISRQEHGTHRISVTELSHLVTQLYRRADQNESERQEVLDELEALRVRAERAPGWLHEKCGDLPLHVQTYLELEDEARRVRSFSDGIIPGPLQVADYVRAQPWPDNTSQETIERTIWMRAQRATRLYDPASGLSFEPIITEGTLRRCASVGMTSQLDTLIERSELPTVALRILPDSSGIHGISSAYVVLDITGDPIGPVMYLEYLGGSFFVDDTESVSRTLSRHESLTALDPDDSRKLLKMMMAQNWRGNVGAV